MARMGRSNLGRLRMRLWLSFVKIHLAKGLPSHQVSLFRAAYAFRVMWSVLNALTETGARFSKVPVTLRARNQIFKSKYKE